MIFNTVSQLTLPAALVNEVRLLILSIISFRSSHLVIVSLPNRSQRPFGNVVDPTGQQEITRNRCKLFPIFETASNATFT